MNKWLVAAGITIAAFSNSCSTDFDLNADFIETPVVYGLLDASVDTQYIRINRPFITAMNCKCELKNTISGP